MKSGKFMRLAVVLTAAAAVLAGCSSSPGAGSTTSSTAAVGPAAKAALAKAYKGIGGDLSDLTPVTPKTGVNFYVMSCGQSLSTCASVAKALADAGTAAGWKSTIVDGKLSPAGFDAAIRQAIAGGANVIVPVGIGCSGAQAAFKAAHDAGIVVVGGGGPDDCTPKEWASERVWVSGYTTQTEFEQYGTLAADWSFGKTDGKATVLTLTGTTNAWGPWIVDGFTSELKKLGNKGSVVGNVNISDPETADGSFVQKVVTALLAHPNVNVLEVPQATWLTAGLYQGIVNAGIKNVYIATSQSDPSTIDTIRSGGQNGDIVGASAQALPWGAWGSVDSAIRILAGQKPAYIGESIQVVDATHNLPSSGDYNGSIDWKSKFLQSWGKK